MLCVNRPLVVSSLQDSDQNSSLPHMPYTSLSHAPSISIPFIVWSSYYYFVKVTKSSGPEVHPDSCTRGTGSFRGVRCGRGVTLTPHHLLVPRSKIEYSYTCTLPKGLSGLWKGETHLLKVPLCSAQHIVVDRFQALSSALNGGEWLASRQGRFTPWGKSYVSTEYETIWTLWRRETFRFHTSLLACNLTVLTGLHIDHST